MYILMYMYMYIRCPNQLHIYITFVSANTKRNKSKSGQVFYCLAHVLLEALNLETELGRAIDKRYIVWYSMLQTRDSPLKEPLAEITSHLVIIHPRFSSAFNA